MIRNYIRIAMRNLKKYKFISFINLFGLTVGLTCCLLILTYILNEVSYDKFQPDAKRVYRVTRKFNNMQTGGVSLNLSTIAPAFGPPLLNDFKEIEDMTRIYPQGTTPVKYNEKIFNEQNTFFADDKLFHFFKTKVEKGNPEKALAEPYSVMLTDEIAKKYFGEDDPMDKIIKINPSNKYLDFKVTGIFKAFPSNTHIHPEVLLSFSSLNDTAIYGAENLRTSFGNNSFFTYIKLPENYNPEKLIRQFPAFLDRYMANEYKTVKPSKGTSLDLQRITDIHLRSHTDYEAEENGDIKRVYIFSAIALFILLIACINYMNLSTARSTLRAKEIGIRKVAGAQKNEIVMQFLSESVLMAWIAMIIAFILSYILLPYLDIVSGEHLRSSILFSPGIMVLLILFPFIVGILSGIYPALFMSSFRPVKVLKGFLKTSGGMNLRKVLVVIQFAISIILIICTGIVIRQMKYMQSKSLGFDKEHIVTLPFASELANKYDAFRSDLLMNSSIKAITRSSRIPTGRLLDEMGARMVVGDTLAPVNTDIKFVTADQDFINTYGVKIIAGRGFSRDFGTDTAAFLINEAAVKALGFKSNDQVIGKDFGYGDRKGKLIGVFNDFHFESLHQKIVPLVLLVPKNPGYYGRVSVKLTGNVPAAIGRIENSWKKLMPDVPFEYTFMDENFAKLYKAEEKQKTLFTIFASLSIFIACLGLFGLSAFSISQRVKEIGIRKVLGANVGSIVGLLSKDFLKLVAVSVVIAFPVAWLAMNSWLKDFAYRINIPVWVFIAAGIIAAAIAFTTISMQAIKAALANPVNNLRTE
ncbi:MAG: FtsX-like permease family protein [Flavisolibacter sp.]